jgi:hypothetical protein
VPPAKKSKDSQYSLFTRELVQHEEHGRRLGLVLNHLHYLLTQVADVHVERLYGSLNVRDDRSILEGLENGVTYIADKDHIAVGHGQRVDVTRWTWEPSFPDELCGIGPNVHPKDIHGAFGRDQVVEGETTRAVLGRMCTDAKARQFRVDDPVVQHPLRREGLGIANLKHVEVRVDKNLLWENKQQISLHTRSECVLLMTDSPRRVLAFATPIQLIEDCYLVADACPVSAPH